jgi:hypothetical protein
MEEKVRYGDSCGRKLSFLTGCIVRIGGTKASSQDGTGSGEPSQALVLQQSRLRATSSQSSFSSSPNTMVTVTVPIITRLFEEKKKGQPAQGLLATKCWSELKRHTLKQTSASGPTTLYIFPTTRLAHSKNRR